MIWSIALVMLVVLLCNYGYERFKTYRCETRGHRWHPTETGWICQRCSQTRDIGDAM